MKTESVVLAATRGDPRTAQWLNRAFNAGLALFLIVLTFPLLALLWLLVRVFEGKPVLYSGIRFGRHKRPFLIYKFRSLVPNAEQILGAQLLTQAHRLVTPLGKFLRDSRLDELPQLYNILRGDMDFVGPRPERPTVYEKICRFIPDYDRRFAVKPGLIGVSQLCTPHGTPKRIRAFIDNRLLAKKSQPLWDAWFVLGAGLVVLRNSVQKLGTMLVQDLLAERVLRRYREKRAFDRTPHDGAIVSWLPAEGGPVAPERARLMDINEVAFHFRSHRKLEPPFPTRFFLETLVVRRNGGRRCKQAAVEGTLFREQSTPSGEWHYVVKYEPISPFQFYMVHQYLLRESVLAP